MIISKTPLRISFFGGGTDLPEFYREFGGAVLGSSIDKYIYHTVSSFPSNLFDYSLRLSYSQVEKVNALSEIQHKPFREILAAMEIERDIEIHLAADLPSYSGLGSSSSFTVGLINALTAFKGQTIQSHNLALKAIEIERDVLQEAVGCQDQIFAAHGGLRIVEFKKNGSISVDRVNISSARKEEFEESLLLFFTGITRKAQGVESSKIKNISAIKNNLKQIFKHVDLGLNLLIGNGPIEGFGALLDETWQEKRQLDPNVSNSTIDQMYSDAISAGALGGKLLGAGGGGFMLFFVPPESQKYVRKALTNFYEVKFSLDSQGSEIIYKQ